MFPFVPACCNALLSTEIARLLFLLITALFLPRNSTPLHPMLTKKLPVPLSLARLIANPDSQSKRFDTVMSSTVIPLSHRSLATRKSLPGCSDRIPLLPAAQIQPGTLVARLTSLGQTSWAITAHAVGIPAAREKVLPDTLPSMQRGEPCRCVFAPLSF